MSMTWNGVMPAITTPFTADGDVDHAFLARHALWMIEAGCTGIVALGSLGEAATLSVPEKLDVLRTLAKALDGRVPLVAGIAALSTDEACFLANEAQQVGCAGLMVLPPYVYSTDWREMRAHVSAVIEATPLPCMLYNNPIAYRTDFRPEHVEELARAHGNLVAVKESSADIRRIAAIRHRLGDRLAILVGVDDVIVEGIAAGATGWVAGLVNAMPLESVRLFDLAMRANSGDAATAAQARQAADELYRWFLPLLTLDTVPKFVQLIKLVQQQVGQGHERVRAPRLVLEGAEREATLALIADKLAARPRNVA
ncbi:dihydrodipicolinate synthase family protein [Scleromatobacter humisilvae]|uniref:Dihydrodipicolinate synthase family protein n=1 Tax=Scleromatobacter humisilvae TaxID=2897159 RepID=A0A9X1YHW4_9BURK|nr:dihydrodipicolinate synthase family protein [Scleromatobacter humisilvae]MCK9686022.1 dihydrodipicolinate synthase family protein [Scleromatobacter humisilvae]